MNFHKLKYHQVFIFVLIIFFIISAELYPQENKKSSGIGLIFGLGVGYGTEEFSVSNENNTEKHIIQQVRLGISINHKIYLLYEYEIHPFDMENPLREEAYRGKYSLFSLQIYPYKRFYVRGGLGIHSRKWSGLNPVTDSDSGGAVALNLGYEMRYKKNYALAIELIYRSTLIEAEGNVKTNFLGFMLTGCFYLHK